MLFNKHNFAVAKFASKGTTRPELEGVFFKADKTVATDSFQLVEISTPKVKVEDFPAVQGKVIMRGFKPFIVSTKGLKDIKFPNNGAVQSLPILSNAGIKHIDENSVEFITTDLEVSNSVSVRRIQGEFPEYESIIPTGDPVVEVIVNAQYLADMLQVLGALDSGSHVKIKIYGKDKPLVIEAGKEQKGRGLLMPIKGN